jgi:hypothetical protein
MTNQMKKGTEASVGEALEVLVKLGVYSEEDAEQLQIAVTALRSGMPEQLKDWYAGQFFALVAEGGHRLEFIDDPETREAARAAGCRLCVAFFGGAL